MEQVRVELNVRVPSGVLERTVSLPISPFPGLIVEVDGEQFRVDLVVVRSDQAFIHAHVAPIRSSLDLAHTLRGRGWRVAGG